MWSQKWWLIKEFVTLSDIHVYVYSDQTQKSLVNVVSKVMTDRCGLKRVWSLSHWWSQKSPVNVVSKESGRFGFKTVWSPHVPSKESHRYHTLLRVNVVSQKSLIAIRLVVSKESDRHMYPRKNLMYPRKSRSDSDQTLSKVHVVSKESDSHMVSKESGSHI